jgi:cell division septation protein DedD
VPDPILSNPDSRLRRSVPEIGSPAVARRGRGWLLAALPVAAGFALFGIIVWLAYKDAARGPLGEPPLIRAAADPIKLPPDQAEESTAAESGAIGRLWSDAERIDQPERLLPLPEDPLSPPVVAAPDASAEPDPSRLGLPPADAAPRADGAAGAAPGAPTAQPAGSAAMAEAEAALDRLLAEVTALSEEQGAPGRAGSPPPAESPPLAQTSPTTTPEAAAAAPTAAASPVTPEAKDETPAATGAPDTAASESEEIRQASALSAPPEVETAPRQPVEEAPATRPAAPQERRQLAAIEDRYRVQLAAVRGEADARRAWNLFLADLGDVLGDVQPFFERAETANGIFYRVQIGPFASQDAAESRCEDLKQRNASCFVIRR